MQKTDPNTQRQALRLRIERQRRRIDRRLHALEREGRDLVALPTYIRRWPLQALLAAVAVGAAASAGLRGQWKREVGLHIVRRFLDKIVGQVWKELQRLWSDSVRRSTPQPEGSGPSAENNLDQA